MSTSIKQNKLVSVGLYLDAVELAALKNAAKKEGRSLSSYVRRLFFVDGCITTQANKTARKRKAA